LKFCVPLLPPNIRLAIVALALKVIVYVPSLVIHAVSPLAGTWFGLQFAAVAKFPPAVFVQMISAACVAAATSTPEKMMVGSRQQKCRPRWGARLPEKDSLIVRRGSPPVLSECIILSVGIRLLRFNNEKHNGQRISAVSIWVLPFVSATQAHVKTLRLNRVGGEVGSDSVLTF
jgi:hypothetical protein